MGRSELEVISDAREENVSLWRMSFHFKHCHGRSNAG